MSRTPPRNIRVFQCPFFQECRKPLEIETFYADDQPYQIIPPHVCMAPFLESPGGGPICLLEMDKDKLTLKNYMDSIDHLDIHRPKMSLLEEMENAWRRWKKS